jgi:uncharacterized protein YndB with AHSA1/START domain
MSTRSVVHSTFSLEREYTVSPKQVFAAWADPAAKARWFAGPGGEHQLDFRVGGREVNRARTESGARLEFESVYHDIVAGHRIVYASTLSAGDTVSTVSITTIEIGPAEAGARLLLTEQATFLDGLEDPSWREQGTSSWLDALGSELGHR